jgi:hypothetical protein
MKRQERPLESYFWPRFAPPLETEAAFCREGDFVVQPDEDSLLTQAASEISGRLGDVVT